MSFCEISYIISTTGGRLGLKLSNSITRRLFLKASRRRITVMKGDPSPHPTKKKREGKAGGHVLKNQKIGGKVSTPTWFGGKGKQWEDANQNWMSLACSKGGWKSPGFAMGERLKTKINHKGREKKNCKNTFRARQPGETFRWGLGKGEKKNKANRKSKGSLQLGWRHKIP